MIKGVFRAFKENPWLIYIYVLFLFVLIFDILIYAFGDSVFGFREAARRNSPIDRTTAQFEEKFEKEKHVSFLLLGYGGGGHSGGNLTDVIKLLVVDPSKKRINLISIPRDLWVAIPIRSDKSEYFKINAAYAVGLDDRNYPLKEAPYKEPLGHFNLSKKVVADVTGVEANWVVSVDFSGFSRAIDELGGIEVNVAISFDDYFYPVKGFENETCGASAEEIDSWHEKYSGFELEKRFACRYEHLHFDKGVVQMDGETALKFVRSRHSDTYGGDFSRAERQMAVLQAIAKKALDLRALDDVASFFERFIGSVRTDLKAADLVEMLAKYPDIADYEVNSIILSTDNVLTEWSGGGGYSLISKDGVGEWSIVKRFVLEEMQR